VVPHKSKCVTKRIFDNSRREEFSKEYRKEMKRMMTLFFS
jgi:hypothetical protein